ncbi:DUF6030 family protein [Rhizobium sp. YIM 134829]|uniref:DUF6030 family protein n=1 Tax=Rhizobium sp. YIM 134829 TaxID=3390453 RepID=UPI003978B338
MKGPGKTDRRTGRLFFWFAFLPVLAAITATVLLANNRRNLDHLLKAMPGLAELIAPSGPRSGAIKGDRTVRVVKGRRVPAATVPAPHRLFANFDAPDQTFLRAIRSDPQALCDRLKDTGFPEIAWTKSAAGGGSWECSSMLPIGKPADEGRVQSSVFVSVKGATEKEVGSFRVKLNIERPEDREQVAETGAKAAGVFLSQVQWSGDGTVTERVRTLQDFDLKDFGSRIQLRKEFGDVPRYNFLATEAFSRHRLTGADRYFDRSEWFPYRGSAHRIDDLDPKLLPPRTVKTVRPAELAPRTPPPGIAGPGPDQTVPEQEPDTAPAEPVEP